MNASFTPKELLLPAAIWMRDFIEAVNEDRVTQNQKDLFASMMLTANDAIAAHEADWKGKEI